MFYVYIIQSSKDGKYYIGFTSDIEKRLVWHNSGRNRSTKCRLPFKLIYKETFHNKKDALKRERQIKAYKGGNAFKKLIIGGVA